MGLELEIPSLGKNVD